MDRPTWRIDQLVRRLMIEGMTALGQGARIRGLAWRYTAEAIARRRSIAELIRSARQICSEVTSSEGMTALTCS